MRGVLFTIALVSMAMVTLSLGNIVMQSGNRERSDMALLSMFDRMRNEVVWIENGFGDIVEKAGISVRVVNHTASITESMPNTNAANFSANIDDWRDFILERSRFQASVSVQNIKDYLPLQLRPARVTYNHPNGPGGDTISVENAGQASNYSIDLDIDIDEEIDLSWDTLDNDPPDMSFRIIVHNSTHSIEENQLLDKAETSTLSISMNSGTITINIGDVSDEGLLVISNPDSLNATIETNITLPNTNKPEITFAGDVVSLYSASINATVSSPITIA